MREVAVKIWDDIDFAGNGTRVEAAVTITIGLDGTEREMDLSETNHRELLRFLEPYLKAGRTPGQPGKTGSASRKKAVPHEYMEGMRIFAKDNGFSYITKKGQYYYPVKLRNAYKEYLNNQGKAGQ